MWFLVRNGRWQFLKSYSIFKAREIICDIVNNKENAGSWLCMIETTSLHLSVAWKQALTTCSPHWNDGIPALGSLMCPPFPLASCAVSSA